MNVCVLGAGMAGCLSAITLQKAGHSVTIVRDSKMGIIGVGEGSTPVMTEWMIDHGFDLNEFARECCATPKYGIHFGGWSKSNPDMYMCFQDDRGIEDRYEDYWKFIKTFGRPEQYITKYHHIAGNRRVPQYTNDHKHSHWFNLAWHMDAAKAANYFEAQCIMRGISVIDGKAVGVSYTESGDIQTLQLESGQRISADFFIDCSGFARYLIQKQLGSEFVDLTDILPIDRAAPIQIEGLDSIDANPLFTGSHALDYGWCWMIPVQDRWGVGVLWSSKHGNAEDAVAEASKLVGVQLNLGRVINFKSGYLKTPWIKNVVAIGLASGFFEPLEATNIQYAIDQLTYIVKALERPEIDSHDDYNSKHQVASDRVAEFINFHYSGTPRDTPFWNDMRKMQMPNNQAILDDIYAGKVGHVFDEPWTFGQMTYQLALRYLLHPQTPRDGTYEGSIDPWLQQILIDQLDLHQTSIPWNEWAERVNG